MRLDGELDMSHKAIEMKFQATPEKGNVSALLMRPDDAHFLLVLGHGASTNMPTCDSADNR